MCMCAHARARERDDNARRRTKERERERRATGLCLTIINSAVGINKKAQLFRHSFPVKSTFVVFPVSLFSFGRVLLVVRGVSPLLAGRRNIRPCSSSSSSSFLSSLVAVAAAAVAPMPLLPLTVPVSSAVGSRFLLGRVLTDFTVKKLKPIIARRTMPDSVIAGLMIKSQTSPDTLDIASMQEVVPHQRMFSRA